MRNRSHRCKRIRFLYQSKSYHFRNRSFKLLYSVFLEDLHCTILEQYRDHDKDKKITKALSKHIEEDDLKGFQKMMQRKLTKANLRLGFI